MAENITAEAALEKLDEIAREWVDKDLEKGIALPFKHWKGGTFKDPFTRLLWRSGVVPVFFGLVVLHCAMNKAWKLFVILLVCYVFYWIVGIVLQRRERGNFILKTDGVTVVTVGEKLFIPWDAIQNISYTYSKAYKLVLQTRAEDYIFYEVYSRNLVKDSEGNTCLAMMPLHVVYKLLTAAKET